MVVHSVKFKTCKVFKVYWIFVGFNKTFMGSVFLGHSVLQMIQYDPAFF